ncbi:alpha/beta fold hydrolase [Trinickia dinghuensis]|uniref:Alpha/beta fold hydrolase n=1 Tax=Trinickia dinghuensis TaxID=2291023 RepID=A0A3D8JST3_9BURK|nr:alpha/beta hydrolase [Trinickia dinghuensis]RDU95785.1 alpha/beta fold hydrolase [Trinickia dinghuensis]
MKPERALHRDVTRGNAAGTSYSVYPPRAGDACETVVLIHGVGMNQSVWSPQIDALTARYRVVAYDMLGHGGSTMPAPVPTLGEYASQLERVLDELEVERAHVVGHSMGALVALEFALTHPQRTRSVVAMNAVYDRTPGQREAVMNRAATLGDAPAEAGIDVTLTRWFGDPVPAHLTKAAEAVRELLLTVDPIGYARTYQLFARSDDAHVGRLSALAVPALFLTGECDANSNPAMSQAMAAVAPFGRAQIIANERHMMNVTNPAQVNERLLEFLLSASTASTASDRPSDAGGCHD